jgi:hypothetical protein
MCGRTSQDGYSEILPWNFPVQKVVCILKQLQFTFWILVLVCSGLWVVGRQELSVLVHLQLTGRSNLDQILEFLGDRSVWGCLFGKLALYINALFDGIQDPH